MLKFEIISAQSSTRK